MVLAGGNDFVEEAGKGKSPKRYEHSCSDFRLIGAINDSATQVLTQNEGERF
jgi:hypothetical protein